MYSIKKFIAILMVMSSPIYSMSINLGCDASFNVNVNTYKYINNGILLGLFHVDVNVTTLSGSGTIRGRNINIKCDDSNFSGSISASNECVMEVKTLGENGTISGDSVTIACDEFKFNGTIFCNGKCTIYAKKAFDESMFKREGTGNFTVIISPLEELKK